MKGFSTPCTNASQSGFPVVSTIEGDVGDFVRAGAKWASADEPRRSRALSGAIFEMLPRGDWLRATSLRTFEQQARTRRRRVIKNSRFDRIKLPHSSKPFFANMSETRISQCEHYYRRRDSSLTDYSETLVGVVLHTRDQPETRCRIASKARRSQ